MSRRLNGGASRAKATLAIVLGSLIAGMAAFVGSAGAEAPAGDPESAAGFVVGYGVGFGVLVWAAAYFLALRKEAKSVKWAGFAIIMGCANAGASFAASL